MKPSRKVVLFFPAFASSEATAPLGLLAVATPLRRVGYDAKLIDRWAMYASSLERPFNCSYCTNAGVYGRQWNALPAEQVGEETVDLATRYGLEMLWIRNSNASSQWRNREWTQSNLSRQPRRADHER